MIEWGFLLIIAAGGLALILMAFLSADPDAAIREFRRSCSESGMSDEEIDAAEGIRIAFVRLRRRASDLCMEKDGKITRSEINDIAGSLAMGIASGHGEDAAKSFIAWVDTCSDSEILYDDARDLRHEKTPIMIYTPDPRMIEDMRAAMKTHN